MTQFSHLVQAVTFSTTGSRMPRAVKRSAILNTSLGHNARQMPQPSAPLHKLSLMEMITGFGISTPHAHARFPKAGSSSETARIGFVLPEYLPRRVEIRIPNSTIGFATRDESGRMRRTPAVGGRPRSSGRASRPPGPVPRRFPTLPGGG